MHATSRNSHPTVAPGRYRARRTERGRARAGSAEGHAQATDGADARSRVRARKLENVAEIPGAAR